MRPALPLSVVTMLCGCSKPMPTLPGASPTLNLTSTSFANGQPMPIKCGAEKGNVSPQLSWSGAPAGVKSFALVMNDPDAPGSSPFTHWVLFNIPSTATQIDEGKTPPGAVEGHNDSGGNGYYGPKPPSGTHHYVIRIYALDSSLELKPSATVDQVIGAMKGHELGMGELVGLYSH